METQAGFSLVMTTMPPITAWATTPSGWAAASHVRRRSPYRQAAMNTSAAISTRGKFSSLLPNSIHVLRRVWPAL